MINVLLTFQSLSVMLRSVGHNSRHLPISILLRSQFMKIQSNSHSLLAGYLAQLVSSMKAVAFGVFQKMNPTASMSVYHPGGRGCTPTWVHLRLIVYFIYTLLCQAIEFPSFGREVIFYSPTPPSITFLFSFWHSPLPLRHHPLAYFRHKWFL